jgi:hypothetical protein
MDKQLFVLQQRLDRARKERGQIDPQYYEHLKHNKETELIKYALATSKRAEDEIATAEELVIITNQHPHYLKKATASVDRAVALTNEAMRGVKEASLDLGVSYQGSPGEGSEMVHPDHRSPSYNHLSKVETHGRPAKWEWSPSGPDKIKGTPSPHHVLKSKRLWQKKDAKAKNMPLTLQKNYDNIAIQQDSEANCDSMKDRCFWCKIIPAQDGKRVAKIVCANKDSSPQQGRFETYNSPRNTKNPYFVFPTRAQCIQVCEQLATNNKQEVTGPHYATKLTRGLNDYDIEQLNMTGLYTLSDRRKEKFNKPDMIMRQKDIAKNPARAYRQGSSVQHHQWYGSTDAFPYKWDTIYHSFSKFLPLSTAKYTNNGQKPAVVIDIDQIKRKLESLNLGTVRLPMISDMRIIRGKGKIGRNEYKDYMIEIVPSSIDVIYIPVYESSWKQLLFWNVDFSTSDHQTAGNHKFRYFPTRDEEVFLLPPTGGMFIPFEILFNPPAKKYLEIDKNNKVVDKKEHKFRLYNKTVSELIKRRAADDENGLDGAGLFAKSFYISEDLKCPEYEGTVLPLDSGIGPINFLIEQVFTKCDNVRNAYGPVSHTDFDENIYTAPGTYPDNIQTFLPDSPDARSDVDSPGLNRHVPKQQLVEYFNKKKYRIQGKVNKSFEQIDSITDADNKHELREEYNKFKYTDSVNFDKTLEAYIDGNASETDVKTALFYLEGSANYAVEIMRRELEGYSSGGGSPMTSPRTNLRNQLYPERLAEARQHLIRKPAATKIQSLQRGRLDRESVHVQRQQAGRKAAAQKFTDQLDQAERIRMTAHKQADNVLEKSERGYDSDDEPSDIAKEVWTLSTKAHNDIWAARTVVDQLVNKPDSLNNVRNLVEKAVESSDKVNELAKVIHRKNPWDWNAYRSFSMSPDQSSSPK